MATEHQRTVKGRPEGAIIPFVDQKWPFVDGARRLGGVKAIFSRLMMKKVYKIRAESSRPPYLDIAVWGAIFLIFCGVFGGALPLRTTVLRGVINTLLLAALFYLNGKLLSSWARPLVQWKYWIAVGIALVVFTFIRGLFNDYIASGSQLSFPRVVGTNDWFWGSALSNFGILALSYLLFLNNRWREAERLRLIQVSERHKAELLQLRSHINPHFLFNVLNNVYALASTGSDRTAPTVLQLSQLLRYVTYQSRRDMVPLEEEFAQLRRYVALFQLRGAQPFNVVLEAKDNNLHGDIEPLLLLPLLENAFKHGDFVENPRAYANFWLDAGEKKLFFRGENSYRTADRQKDGTSGVGLENIRKRLALTYGDAASLAIKTDDSAGIFSFVLTIHR
ncbi:sensor histidine kinase [Neolewinella persica]|uniref:sensor histidine kinase n=1 Tax=Neolewinella persica TaxID=70998 RepID=UPI00146B7DC6|nr:sensor histidine kinase [Neolewinella persica]